MSLGDLRHRRLVPVVAGLVLLGSVVGVCSLARLGGPTAADEAALGRPGAAAPVVLVPVVLEPVAAAAPVAASGPTLQPAPRWVDRVALRTGVPVPAVRAYARAALVSGSEQPGCKLGWTTLAGIGWVESQHGTLGGRVLGDDGVPSAPVAGPELDGSGPYAAIPEGDAWSRALGPLQFLPSTWATWAADGDGDGRADVDDLDDAALAAARYLCADGHVLATGSGWTAAIRSYNHSDVYVQSVFAATTAYNARL